MLNSIRHFQEKGVKNLTEVFSHYTDDPTKFAEMVRGVTKEVTRLGLSIIEEELESYDQLLRERQDLRKGWYIERRDETKLLTSLGEIRYNKTYFHNRETGEYGYLLDQLMGLEKHARISEDAGSKGTKELWQEVFKFIESSYAEDVLERIYINGDGAKWIRTGAKMYAKAHFVLDHFHMHKYIISATSHLKDSAQDARSEIYRATKGKQKRAAGVEEVIYSATQMLSAESKNRAKLGELQMSRCTAFRTRR